MLLLIGSHQYCKHYAFEHKIRPNGFRIIQRLNDLRGMRNVTVVFMADAYKLPEYNLIDEEAEYLVSTGRMNHSNLIGLSESRGSSAYNAEHGTNFHGDKELLEYFRNKGIIEELHKEMKNQPLQQLTDQK